MGEWSKRIGEAGEKLVSEYFNLIGWADAQKGLQIQCIKPEKHPSPGKDARNTHGIDFLFTYVSPLMEGVLHNVVASVKFTNDEYPNNPSGLFRKHVKDLAQTIECFKSSPDRQKTIAGQKGIKRCEEVGVLFWLSNAEKTYDDLLGPTSNVHVPDIEGHSPIYLVDNKRAAFLFDSLTFARRSFPGAEVEFYYFDTGNNTNPLIKQHNGPALPVQYVNSSILPIRVSPKDSDNTILMLFCIEGFSEDGLKLLMGMAQNLSGSWASRIYICFPDYSPLNHENFVQRAKAAFFDKKTTSALVVRSYATDFLTLQG